MFPKRRWKRIARKKSKVVETESSGSSEAEMESPRSVRRWWVLLFNRFRRNLCCKVSKKFKELIVEEERVVRECEVDVVKRVKKLLLMSRNGVLHVPSLRFIRKELGLPEDFRDLVLAKYSEDCRLVYMQSLELVNGYGNESLCVAKVEEWREVEYREKWLSEFETK